ncbi:benzoate 4-monooxygenase cytochrome P450 [Lineolata rhizophorae]|uniref:Benzoate 4-monooxygenase cytochrome P450 n=1 Tax=Lineolata rhizophorae TaxID=578093 RepID=A0A6A6NUD4_9PEZI|nr:benzoate 4-monooxygenase cytochrome P450 [Lineolata rhizophorae]
MSTSLFDVTAQLGSKLRPTSVEGILNLTGAVLVAVVVQYVASVFYAAYFGPLSHIPGPKLAGGSWLIKSYYQRQGTLIGWMTHLHEKYGPVVRVGPTEVSFITGESAWQDIYGFHHDASKTGKYYLKDREFFSITPSGVWSMIAEDEANHSKERRLFSHAFSEKALREQEPLLQRYVDLLQMRLHEESESGKLLDLQKWYNYTTFDIIADLAFGESFECLSQKSYHPMVVMTFKAAAAISMKNIMSHFPIAARFSSLFIPQETLKKRIEFYDFTKSRVERRLAMDTARPDFTTAILKHSDTNRSLSRQKIYANMGLFMIAGSETTATMLTGTTYLLLMNPDIMQKLNAEVRGRFKSANDITIEEVNKLPYLLAVLTEGLRMYPPVPIGFPRVVPRGGDTISGVYVPEACKVYVSQYHANHSPRNWVDPEKFAPERWLGDERYAGDNKANYNPFSFGPRNCLGKNLAYAEMRLILAKTVFSFDMELAPESENWFSRNKVFSLWEKPPLMASLTAVN